MKNRQLSSGLLCALSVLSAPALTQESETEEIPTLEFLEFLGSFEDNSGTWRDPFEINNDDDNKPIEINTQQGEKQ